MLDTPYGLIFFKKIGLKEIYPACGIMYYAVNIIMQTVTSFYFL